MQHKQRNFPPYMVEMVMKNDSPKSAPPCRICGALPTRKRIKSAGKYNIKVDVMVYPCGGYDQAEKEKEKQKIWSERLKRSKIPPRYRTATLELTGFSPYEKIIIPKCTDFIESAKKRKVGGEIPEGFGLIGDVGVGKTYYICAIEITLLRLGWPCLFLNVPDFYDELKGTFSADADPERYKNLLDRAKEIYVVAFDDIGAEYNTQWTVDELCKIVNYRYNYNLITLFTSNLRAEELAERIGKRATDRLKEMCRVHLITGQSLRTKKKKTNPPG